MIHVIYKTTNLINGRFYIGKHSTTNTNDYYIGSGKVLRNAIRKYGRENFKKEILATFENEMDAYHKEREILTEDVLSDPLCYNLRVGGLGNPKGLTFSVETRKKLSESHRGEKNGFYGKTHSTKTKESISKKKRGIPLPHSVREILRNKMWITNGVESKPYNKNESVPDGWRAGRTFSKEICEKYRQMAVKRNIENNPNIHLQNKRRQKSESSGIL